MVSEILIRERLRGAVRLPYPVCTMRAHTSLLVIKVYPRCSPQDQRSKELQHND